MAENRRAAYGVQNKRHMASIAAKNRSSSEMAAWRVSEAMWREKKKNSDIEEAVSAAKNQYQ